MKHKGGREALRVDVGDRLYARAPQRQEEAVIESKAYRLAGLSLRLLWFEMP